MRPRTHSRFLIEEQRRQNVVAVDLRLLIQVAPGAQGSRRSNALRAVTPDDWLAA